MSELTPSQPDAASSVQVVDTEGGPITLVDLAGLRTRVSSLEAEANKAAQSAKSLRALAESRWMQAGRLLTAKPDGSSPSPQVTDLMRQAALLSQQISSNDSEVQSIQARKQGGISGLAGKLGSWNESRKLSGERVQLESQLRSLLTEIGRGSPAITLAEIDVFRGQGGAADIQAQELEHEAASLSAVASSANDELKRRTDAEHDMGFDAPYLVAYLKTYGPKEVQSPLILKRAERAYAVAPASLARQQTRRQWVGGSQGFSFPIGHTGIRYRVGSFHGHPIQQQFLGKLDSGTLVITNQRIAFIGQLKSTSFAFSKLLHVQCYADALAVFQEARETPDFYLTAQPKYVLFMINWFLSLAAS